MTKLAELRRINKQHGLRYEEALALIDVAEAALAEAKWWRSAWEIPADIRPQNRMKATDAALARLGGER